MTSLYLDMNHLYGDIDLDLHGQISRDFGSTNSIGTLFWVVASISSKTIVRLK